MQFFILNDLDYSNSKLNLKYICKIVDVTSTCFQLKVPIFLFFNLQHFVYDVYAYYCIGHVFVADMIM